MRRDNITINAVPDWKLSYPPELVGEYLHAHYESIKGFDYGEVIEMKPGTMLPLPPEPTLEAFLTWCYQRTEHPELLKTDDPVISAASPDSSQTEPVENAKGSRKDT